MERGAVKKTLVVLLVIAGVAAFFLYKPLMLGKEAKRFAPKLLEYESLACPPDPAGVSEGVLYFAQGTFTVDAARLPRRSGKLFAVKLRKMGTMVFPADRVPQVDNAWYELGGDLRASSPEEVGTLVQVAYTLEEAQGYVDPSHPFRGPPVAGSEFDLKVVLGRRTATMKVIDLQRKLLVGSWKLVGEAPPPTVKRDKIDKLLMQAPPVAAFLKALPAR
jgi:hypothetical protein